jgi:hypothetical protein
MSSGAGDAKEHTVHVDEATALKDGEGKVTKHPLAHHAAAHAHFDRRAGAGGHDVVHCECGDEHMCTHGARHVGRHTGRRLESVGIANDARFNGRVWRSCCLDLDSRAVLFFSQLGFSVAFVTLCGYILLTSSSCGMQQFAMGGIMFVIGVWLPQPKSSGKS